jgi:hypothetical protein
MCVRADVQLDMAGDPRHSETLLVLGKGSPLRRVTQLQGPRGRAGDQV